MNPNVVIFWTIYNGKSNLVNPPLAAAGIRAGRVLGELPVHVGDGQAGVWGGWKSAGWRNRFEYGAGDG